MDYDSAMDYYIILDKGEIIYASDTKAEQIKKGINVKYYRYSDKVDTLLLGKEGIVIKSFVDKNNVRFDSTFILVDQKPLDSICECDMGCGLAKYGTIWNKSPTYKLCKEALEKSTFHQYWIINKKEDIVYGPLSKEAYFQKRKELGISEKLKIDIE